MFDLKNFFLWNNDFFNFEDREISNHYHDWYRHAKQGHITAVSALTAVLYLLYYQLNRLVAPQELMSYMMIIELCLLPLALFTISYLSAKKINYNFMIALLMLAPVVAATGNMLIVGRLEVPQTYLTEVYLIIVWVFILSGLRLLHATISVIGMIVFSLGMSYFIYPLPKDIFIMHIFWLFLSFSLGFFGAYVLEKLSKDTFLAYEELIVLSATDSLTGFQDKKHLEEIIDKEISRNLRYGHHFSLLSLDIDNFGDINKTYGNQVGDLVLIEMAKLIKQQIRLSDTVLRLGGEEFVIVYQETDAQIAKKLAEKLRHAIEQYDFKSVGKKTISAGVTSYKEHDDAHLMIARAEAALSKAKSKGKNRIETL
ncbi:MAG: GGDEF domain-containing protein [Sulfurimonas sp.]|nr:GGDEF domain-containing protein [Sulfurimonas sp.]MBU1217391.1 GGDEF domain-containing protein [bacterium]MBU1433924.1 GGDEF domain-containing protein [bacterium]MBU1503622.1 GGDEF domain-containing protein [bacterium]MBU3938754.1 GGDEF domain-containing protein [bacterium]